MFSTAYGIWRHVEENCGEDITKPRLDGNIYKTQVFFIYVHFPISFVQSFTYVVLHLSDILKNVLIENIFFRYACTSSKTNHGKRDQQL